MKAMKPAFGSAQHSTSAAASQASFKGSLLLLQNKTKRDPESYYEEFMAQLRHFDALSKVTTTAARLSGGGKSASAQTVLSGTGAAAAAAAAAGSNAVSTAAAGGGGGGTASAAAQEDAQFSAVLQYLCHVSHCFPKECAHIPDVLLTALRANGSKMNPITRRTFVQCLTLLRSKGLVTPDKTMPVLFDLLLLRDKILRKNVLSHIVSDIRRFNQPGKGQKGAQQFNRIVQNFLFGVVQQDDPTQTRCAMFVMLDLYRRGVWANERCVEVMTQACFSRHTAVIRTALRFFLMQFPRRDGDGGEAGEDDDPEEPTDKALTESMTRAMHKQKIKAKTRKRARVLKRVVKSTKSKLDPEHREQLAFQRQDIDPVRLLRDPQSFCERLFAALQRTSERFEVRLLFLSVIARVISEHQTVVLQLYPYLERFLQPSQIQAPTLLALASTCIHPLVPPDAVEPLVRSIANHFVNDRSQPDAITIGLNTIREICKRQPLAMTEDLLRDLVEYRTMRGERGIIMAARSLIQLYRQVDPTLLPPKLRAGHEVANKPQFGAAKAHMDIPGLEALYSESDNDEQDLSGFEDKEDDDDDDDDGTASTSSSSMIDIPLSDDDDDDSEDGGWEWQNDDDDVMSDDEDGSEGFVDVPQSSDEEDDDDDSLLDFDEEDDEEEEDRDFDDDDDDDDDDEDEDDDDQQQRRAKAAKKFQVSRADQHLIKSKRFADDIWEDSGDDDDDDDEQEQQQKQKQKTLKKHRVDEAAATGGKRKTQKQQQQRNGSESPPRLIPNSDPHLHRRGDVVAASADAGMGWMEDTVPTVADKKKSKAAAAAAGGSRGESSEHPGTSSSLRSTASSRVSSMRFLTDADFEKLRRIQAGADPNEWKSPRGRKKELQEMRKRKRELLEGGAGAGDMVQTSAIESFTDRKRSADKEEKITAAQEARRDRQPFNIRKKKKSKLNSTHTEKSKRGKLFHMTKRSARVGAKLKMSVEDRRQKQNEMKKKNIKFRIARGWKA